MARPRKPTAALELTGAFSRNPKRGKARENEPRPLGKIGDPPETLAEDAAIVWEEMAAEGFWLTSADRFQLEIAAKYMAYFRIGGSDTKTIGQLIAVLNKLGFSPAERSKINGPKPAEEKESEDPFAQFK
jgi:phage terminase small subunit